MNRPPPDWPWFIAGVPKDAPTWADEREQLRRMTDWAYEAGMYGRRFPPFAPVPKDNRVPFGWFLASIGAVTVFSAVIGIGIGMGLAVSP